MNGPKQKVLIVFYSLSGVTRRMAEMLREKTGADIYEIETVRTYSTDHEEPKRELESGDLPALTSAPPDMASYDLILVGGPVWWYPVSTPVMRFLQEADFAGKRVAPFCTHLGGLGRYFEHFSQQARNAKVLDGIEIFKPVRSRENTTQKQLEEWLSRVRPVK